jgi:hypothetical protein
MPSHPPACATLACAAVLTFAAPAVAAEFPQDPPLRAKHYFQFADRIAAGMRADWVPSRRAYVSELNGPAVRTNVNLLIVHAVAALRGHRGPSRADARARLLVQRLIRRPMSLLRARRAMESESICWATDLDSGRRGHISLDSQVAEALAWAWKARGPLGLRPMTARRIVRTVERCARHAGWRYPRALANQINWNAQLYASVRRVSGHGALLRGDYRRHLARFVAGIRTPQPGMRTTNLGPGFAFHYQPGRSPLTKLNFDAPEYANIVATALQHYPEARRAGMAPLPPGAVGLLRGWVRRLLAGAWTHAGYLNWDTGYGYQRWHSGQYWAFSQQGLLAIATARPFWPHPRAGAWAKALFDRGLILYSRWSDEAGAGVAPKLPFGVHSRHEDYDLYATRIAANAMRAVGLGLGGMAAQDPPPLYAYDSDTGRLAVTTPRYSTAIVPSNRRAFAYGGIGIARLYGRAQRPLGTIGGTPPGAFGVVVRDARGHERLASQRGKRFPGSLRLTGRELAVAPPLAGHRATPAAGRFAAIGALGHVARGAVRMTSTHRFRPDSIETRWAVTCSAGCAGSRVDAHFPSWGRGAHVVAVLRGGVRVRLFRDGPVVRLGDVARVELAGYDVVPLEGPAEARLRLVGAPRQATNPDPGPTLAIRLVDRARLTGVALAVRVIPVG